MEIRTEKTTALRESVRTRVTGCEGVPEPEKTRLRSEVIKSAMAPVSCEIASMEMSPPESLSWVKMKLSE